MIPFSDKNIGSKKLFRRKNGITATVAAESMTVVEYSIPYNHALLNELEIINCNIGDIVTLKVMDDDQGTYSGVPNAQLNEFSNNLNLCDGVYNDDCNYASDAFLGIVLRFEYTNGGAEKDIGINIVLHELK